ncbi:hypothetical protein C2S52_007628 [Perilla frutescens var. hirtella]|nr:hypothetical protein C2S52_007628 [Perilla frutescens var. hirtella]
MYDSVIMGLPSSEEWILPPYGSPLVLAPVIKKQAGHPRMSRARGGFEGASTQIPIGSVDLNALPTTRKKEPNGTQVLIPVTWGLIELFINKHVPRDEESINYISAHNGEGAAAANRVNGPVLLQKFDSGVMVIQSKTHSDEESTVDTQGLAKRLKQCIKWFQQLEGNYATEQEKLKNLLEVPEKKCSDAELMMKENEDELNSIIMELRKNLDMLQEKHAKEELDKLLLNDMYKRLQEYNTSLQQYNSRLQSELHETNETLKHVEKEKTTVVEKP